MLADAIFERLFHNSTGFPQSGESMRKTIAGTCTIGVDSQEIYGNRGNSMRKHALWLVIISILAMPSAWAMNTNRQIIMLGDASKASCGTYTLTLAHGQLNEMLAWHGQSYSSSARTYAQWLAGFVSGVNSESSFYTARGIQVRPVDVNGLALWVERYCKVHPDALLISAAWRYIMTHREGSH